ncbi:nuclear control of ATPase protein 2 [Coccidioides immitis RMSCC 3703]|uniref:Nuclear control of ATPase protein 2 n=1 Tax=Coccidioides immitis RMSCC 3703 TaxID=454286 RepID=A0A0J8R010_COCIT|nr:nuclear control of ATPase protein 2 [Coccidioides immitis RMSCC 3703]
MSLVEDHVRRLDLYLDKLQLRALDSAQPSSTDQDESIKIAHHLFAPPVAALAGIARALSAGSSSGPLLKPSKLLDLLRQVCRLRSDLEHSEAELDDGLRPRPRVDGAAKATVQAFAIVWLYAIRLALRFGTGSGYLSHVCGYDLSRARLDSSPVSALGTFYQLVRESAKLEEDAGVECLCRRPLDGRSPAVRIHEEDTNTNTANANPEDWQDTVFRTTLLIRTILNNVNDLSNDFNGFEDNVFASVDAVDAPFIEESHQKPLFDQAFSVIQQLIDILEEQLPHQRLLSRGLTRQYGRPSRLVRYWLPASAFLFSSSTILNILTNRRAELVTWVRELGTTMKDFWVNWVIEPLNQLVGTIRHDEKSEVALMSKGSLQSDFASLERMVVDYAIRHPEHGPDRAFTHAELEQIRSGVREGDLTLVLKAYERDLQTPFMGAVRGDLITTLLIQIQKTKVDVEVAMSGIDSLLQSQQLVFAFIGLTPGILVSYSAITWLTNVFGSQKGLRRGKRREEARRSLRAVNRILASSVPTPTGVLSYKDHGLLICEAEILRRRAYAVLPGHIYHEFHEDLTDLLNVSSGIVQQLRVLEQIRWAYSRWIC